MNGTLSVNKADIYFHCDCFVHSSSWTHCCLSSACFDHSLGNSLETLQLNLPKIQVCNVLLNVLWQISLDTLITQIRNERWLKTKRLLSEGKEWTLPQYWREFKLTPSCTGQPSNTKSKALESCIYSDPTVLCVGIWLQMCWNISIKAPNWVLPVQYWGLL